MFSFCLASCVLLECSLPPSSLHDRSSNLDTIALVYDFFSYCFLFLPSYLIEPEAVRKSTSLNRIKLFTTLRFLFLALQCSITMLK